MGPEGAYHFLVDATRQTMHVEHAGTGVACTVPLEGQLGGKTLRPAPGTVHTDANRDTLLQNPATIQSFRMAILRSVLFPQKSMNLKKYFLKSKNNF